MAGMKENKIFCMETMAALHMSKRLEGHIVYKEILNSIFT